ncbi:hypothetical protein [Streptomyces yaizuensis]|uniref:Uncharacterized protein n=1 Tax=Streptomyces yaizuensis TaxID=2989713 RepID=A0ABQ5NRI8_9ACTN|nr:hypothetical protein [Streptomyces sp. YSPA8]GLF92887.1 hypothetical protein SYYSPA8_01340 [Streptomyces sp. YSPA8]
MKVPSGFAVVDEYSVRSETTSTALPVAVASAAAESGVRAVAGPPYPKAQDRLTDRCHAELAEVEKRKIRKLRDVDKRIDALAEELRQDLARALAGKQAAYVRDQLTRRVIAQSPPHGIGPTLAARLAAAGIRTAADFLGYRTVQNGSYTSTGAVLVSHSGQFVNVQGIGEAKAIALDEWRKAVLASAVARQPSALAPVERQSIHQGVTLRRAQLTDQRRTVEYEADALRTQARKQLEEGQERLTRENALAGDKARQQRQEFGRRTVEIQQNSALHGRLSAEVRSVRHRRRGLSYACYLRFLCIGR